VRFSVVTCGSEGDTRPLASLCRGLMDQGHEVRLFADHSTLTLPRILGVPCEPLQGDVKSILPIGDPRQKLRISEVMRVGKELKAWVASHSASWLRTVGEHARRSDAILFSSLATGIGLTLRDELRKPAAGLLFQPIAPTREFSSTALPPMKLPGWLNLWTYGLLQFQMRSLFGTSAAKARREVFGTKSLTRRPAYDFPTFYCISKELVAQPADWPPDHIICGHWYHPMTDWQPPRDLLDFIGDDPPIYAGFGSPSAFVRAKALKILVAAVGGCRVVFSPGWSNIDRSVLPDNFFIARDVPHEWLFSRVSLAVHHGGAGTTHTAARAGLPQVILPFGADQFFWAQRLVARGVAPKAPGRSARTAAGLAKMIAFAQLDSTRQKAKDLGQAMAAEDGVRRAVREIEALARRARRA
jgi:sterol 3beta-glucosyltransferase